MMSRKKSTPKQLRETVARAKRAFNEEYFREGMVGGRNESMGDGGEQVGDTDGSYHDGDVTATRDKKSWGTADEGEAGGYKMAEDEMDAEGGKFHKALQAGGYKKSMLAKSGHTVYQSEDGHKVWVSGRQCYSKNAEGEKIHHSSVAELEAAMHRRGKAAESVRTFFKRYAKEI